MVDQLSAFASEVTRVALEVGTQGILGGQARVEGVQGTWADLTRNVNVAILIPPPFISLHLILLAENGLEFDRPGALNLRSHQSGSVGGSQKARERRRAGRCLI
jgi:hypothetical protein